MTWTAVGVQVATYELAVDNARTRQQFGKPLARFELIQEHLATILGTRTASLAIAVRVAQLQDQGQVRDDQAALAQALRHGCGKAWPGPVRCSAATGSCTTTRRARLFIDAEALCSDEGTREMNTLIVGRAATGISAFV